MRKSITAITINSTLDIVNNIMARARQYIEVLLVNGSMFFVDDQK